MKSDNYSLENKKFMRQAIALAEKGQGLVSPNPLVGAIVVKSGKVISKGFHSGYGKGHAEIEALKDLNPRVKADLYVTLEPCAHYGKTPPCVDIVKKFKFNNIYIGVKDPNPQVNGKSINTLKKLGYNVHVGLLNDEIKKQNETYFHYMSKKRPFVTLKAAVTLDGKIATHTGESKWITAANSRKWAHKLRIEHDAIMVGIGTVVADDPLLIPINVSGKGFRPPSRIVIDPTLRIEMDSKIVKTAKAYPTIIICGRLSDKSKEMQLEKRSVKIIHLPLHDGRFKISEILDDLGGRNISSLMIEGGSNLNSAAWKEKVIDKLVFFVAPKMLGGNMMPVIGGLGVDNLEDALNMKVSKVEFLDPDILIEAYIK